MPQPHRGKRYHLSMRLPVEIIDEVDRKAEREGLTRSDYITQMLATQHGLTVPSYIHRIDKKRQPQLPDPERRLYA